MDDVKSLLNKLMGSDRDLLPDEKRNKPSRHFSEREVCKYYICGFCPHDLFVNTRSDLGECKKIHDEELRRQWDACTEKEKFRYEDEYIRYLEKLVADLERKMKKSQSTLNRRKTKDENNLMDSAQLEQLDKRSEELFKTMAKYSEENQLEEANKTMAELEELKKQKKELTDKIESGSQEKRMELCQICGAYLVIGDTEKRISSHLDGKQHKGYEMIRNRIDEHYSNKETERKKREKEHKSRSRSNSRSPSYSPKKKKEIKEQ